MRMMALSFAAGTVLLQGLPRLPDPAAVALLVLTVASCQFAEWRSRGERASRTGAGQVIGPLLLAFVMGFGWAAVRADLRLAEDLRGELEGVDIELSGYIAELPQQLDDGLRFRFDVELAPEGVPERLLLSWYRPRGTKLDLPILRPGERWRFVVRLKRPHGFSNPAGFDYEAWLLERGVRATGHVRHGALRLDTGLERPMDVVHRLRNAVRERFNAVLGDADHAGMLVAIAVGDQRGIPSAQWEVFRRTGVAHLVAISGLHITLVASAVGGAIGIAWRRSPRLVLWCPTRKAQALSAAMAAAAYALLAGLGIPVQRALIMLMVFVVALYCGRAIKPSRVMALALVGVLVFDPWASLSAGFWLSFAAVGAISFVMSGRLAPSQHRAAAWAAAVRVQLAISLALLPLLLVMFQSVPLLSPIANALAIPVVSFVVTPLVLLAALLQLDFLLHVAHQVTTLLMLWLEWLAGFDSAYWRQAAAPSWLMLLAVMAVIGAMLPRGTPGKLASLAVLAAVFAWPSSRPASGSFVVRVLDVGQGLAVHVQTERHDLLFDTGPPYGPQADAGNRVVQPYLQVLGVARLDRLVLSHDDSDHVGGARSLVDAVEVLEVLTSDVDAITQRGFSRTRRCEAGERWQWDGVQFEFLHPDSVQPAVVTKPHDNDRSCVLRVTNAGGSLLLLGDVEVGGERAMLSRYGDAALSADVVVSAHHGSRSSSSSALVEASLPQAVIHSVGHRNAFGHPHPEVWARWAAAGARNWRTDSQGAIEAVFAADESVGVQLSAQRARAPRYWHGR